MAAIDSIRIDTKTGRGKLKPRRDPYWHKLAVRKHLGCRKLADGSCRWIARLTTPDRKYLFKALGDDAELSFDDAAEAARCWFGDTDPKVAEGADIKYTLQNALDDYVAHLRVSNSDRAANEIQGRLTRHIPEPLRKKPVADLTTARLKEWRDGMVKVDDDPEVVRKSKDSANRRLNSFKAALNLAWRSGLVADDTAWRRLESFKKVSASRELYLTEKQVARLIDKAKGGLRTLIRAGVLTGARRGELLVMTAADFDSDEGTLLVRKGKTGRRTIYLSDTAVDFFEGLTRGKLPEAHLFTKDDGTPWPEDDVRRPFLAAIRAAKMPAGTNFYSLRHYHISRALLAGVQPQVVAENCGTSLRMLEQHYGKFMKTDRRAMFNRVAL